MAKKELTKTSKVLLWLCAGLSVVDSVMVTPKELRRRSRRGNLFKDSRDFDNFLYYLLRQGYIKFVDKNNVRFVKITGKGELKTLIAKTKMVAMGKWDGKWRVIVFDIPEESRQKRNLLRGLLKQIRFAQLQASVFISPYPLNREAIKYLKETGLINYIRIMKVEEMDDDSDLKKKFGLK